MIVGLVEAAPRKAEWMAEDVEDHKGDPLDCNMQEPRPDRGEEMLGSATGTSRGCADLRADRYCRSQSSCPVDLGVSSPCNGREPEEVSRLSLESCSASLWNIGRGRDREFLSLSLQERSDPASRRRLESLADRMLLEDLMRDRAADHLGRMRGIPRLRRGGFSLIGLPPDAKLSGLARLKALGLSELLLQAREYEERHNPGEVELGYWWLARAKILKALTRL